MTEIDKKDWDEQLEPLLHDDGKGLSMCFHLVNEKNGTDLAVHFDARYPEEGFPSYDSGDLADLTVYAAIEFGHIMWPDKFPTYDEIMDNDKHKSTEEPPAATEDLPVAEEPTT